MSTSQIWEKTKGKSSVRQQGQECLQGIKSKKITQNYSKYQYVKYKTGFTIKKIAPTGLRL